MDLQRNILIVALLVVSWLLFVSWQNEYGQNATINQAATPPAGNTQAGTQTPVITSTTESGDLADVPAIPVVPAVPEALTPQTSRVVSVRTDVLNLEIDLYGGDITRLTLPKYPQALNTPDSHVQLMTTGATTYLAQSGLVVTQGPTIDAGTTRANYTTRTNHFALDDGKDTLEVVLSLPEQNGIAIEKVYRFRRGDYLVDVFWRVHNGSTELWTGLMFGQLKRDGSGDPSHPGGGGFFSTSPTYLGAAYYSNEAVYNKAQLSDIEEAPVKLEAKGGWIAFIQHYFIGAWIPPQDQINNFTTRYRKEDRTYLFGFTSPQVTVAPGTMQEIGAGFYAGPKIQDHLKKISKGLDLTVDYGWFWFISQPLLWLLTHIEQIFGNWGVAIILLTVLVKALFFYPSHISYRSMAHMRRVTPELTRIRDEYKNDRQKQSQEMLALYRKEKINPLGGCLPILIQMPVFIALYWVLMESVELRQAPFVFWIKDLSAMDPYFVLPILMGISMWYQTKLNPAPPDPMQAKMMQWLPWIFTLFFLFFASGLVLYWLVNNILSIAQQWFITKKVEKEHAKA
ncbi:MAG: membrane protein insertase YidC [Pseudomonadota bacterium]